MFAIPFVMGGAGCPSRIKPYQPIKEVARPVPFCPAPPDVERPVYEYETVTPEQLRDSGTVAKTYIITCEQAKHYADQLEEVLKTLRENSEQWSEMRARLLQEGVDPKILDEMEKKYKK